MTTWTMPGIDFMMLCSRFGRDRLPYPLAVTIDVDTVDELRQLRLEASARIDHPDPLHFGLSFWQHW